MAKDTLFGELTSDLIKGSDSQVADATTFIESNWGFGIKLTPAQRVVVKAFYSIPLDDTDLFPIYDVVKDKIIGHFTEKSFMQWMYDNKRCNYPDIPKNPIKELVLVAGRRGGKCRAETDIIHTSIGIISFKELFNRKLNGEKIEILTYDPVTFLSKKTSDFKIWENGERQCFCLKTRRDYVETSSFNHPYYVWKKEAPYPEFISLEKIEIGDKIAVASKMDIFAEGGVGEVKAKLLGKETREGKITDDSVPGLILRGNKKEIKTFLSQIFSRNVGSPAESIEEVVYSSPSEKLIRGVRSLLLKFGIFSICRETKVNYGLKTLSYDLTIDGNENLKRFSQEIELVPNPDSFSPCLETDKNNDEIYWDEVESITNVGNQRTVDLTIEDTHIIGGEIISHNTLITSCILGYELYKLIKKGDPAKFYGKPEQQTIVVTNVAPTDDQAGLVYDFTITSIEHCPIMKNRINNKTQKYFSLFTDKDLELGKNKASLEFLTGGCSSNGLRGPDAIAVSMDEMAFFLTNESSKFSGAEVYGALTPSCKGFSGDGKVICISSPHARYGKFYDLYKQGMEEKESTTLVFQMYTAMINPDKITSDDLKLDRRRNRRKFLAEYAAEFSDSVNAWVDDPNEFDCIVDKNFNIPKKGKPDIRYYAGLDLAFTNDGTALSVVHNENGIITLDYSNVWFSGSSDVWLQEEGLYRNCSKYKHLSQLQMEDIVKEVKEVDKWFPIKRLVFDQHNGQGFLERCRQNEIMFAEMINFNDTLNSEIYEVTKRLYAEKLLRIWNHPILIPELQMLEAEVTGTSGYKYDVHAPRRTGCHDDISESYARAVWTCYNDKHKNSRLPATGTYLSRDARYQAMMSKYNSGNPRSNSRIGDKRGFYR